MALRLRITSRHEQSLGERAVKEFGPGGGTIGRSLESDWVLPDGQRFVSSRHASIDFRSGSYYIIDTSTNGVYVNEAAEPVGRGNPQRLFDGDRIRLGDYEMSVEVDDIDSTREQLADLDHIDPVDRAQKVEAPDPTSGDLVDAFEITGVGFQVVLDESHARTRPHAGEVANAEELRLEESGASRAAAGPVEAPAAAAPTPRQPAPSKAAPSKAAPSEPAQGRAASSGPASSGPASSGPATRAAARSSEAPAPAQPSAANPNASPADAARALGAFFKGAGLAPRALNEREAEQTLHLVGQIFRETIVGLTENLHLRSAQKAMLRQTNTTIEPRDNNPLKFSAGVEEAMDNLVFRQSEQYLSPVAAVRGAFKDVKLHQQAVMHAMQAAVSSYVEKFDPDRLEEKLSNGRRGALINATNKLKYWDFFKDLYVVVAEHPHGELPVQFAEELAAAYEREMAREEPPEDAGIQVNVG